MPLSQCNNIVIRNIRNMQCNTFYAVSPSDKYLLKDFTFENIDATDDKGVLDASFIEGITVKNVVIKARP
jgi:hypothetical protein